MKMTESEIKEVLGKIAINFNGAGRMLHCPVCGTLLQINTMSISGSDLQLISYKTDADGLHADEVNSRIDAYPITCKKCGYILLFNSTYLKSL